MVQIMVKVLAQEDTSAQQEPNHQLNIHVQLEPTVVAQLLLAWIAQMELTVLRELKLPMLVHQDMNAAPPVISRSQQMKTTV